MSGRPGQGAAHQEPKGSEVGGLRQGRAFQAKLKGFGQNLSLGKALKYQGLGGSEESWWGLRAEDILGF